MPIITSEAPDSLFVQVEIENMKLNVHYHDIGVGSKAIVMLHGSGPGATGWANFHRNVAPLADAGYRIILIDFPGWGRSDPIVCTGSRSDFNAKIVTEVLNKLSIEQAHLIGNSMGAHSAVAFALANPTRIARLILMGGGTGGASIFSPMPAEGIKLLQALYRSPTLENLKQMMNVFVFDPSSLTDDLLQMRLAAMLERKDHLENFLSSLAANPRQFPDQSDRLSMIKAETLIVWGRDDRFMPLDIGLRLLWNIPRSDMEIFSRCGHWAQWEHADKFNQNVINFLGR